MKVLITGGNGYLAGKLFHELSGFKVTLYKDNVLDINKEINDYDIIFHFAGKTKNAKYDEFYKNNVIGTKEVIKFCEKNNSKLIFMSTCGVYGWHYHQEKINETTIINEENLNDYQKTKFLAEKEVVQSSCRYIVLRLFNLYGTGQQTSYLVPEIVDDLKSDKNVLLKSPENILDFVFVDDVTKICRELLDLNIENEIINIGTGIGHSVYEVAKKVALKLSLPIERIKMNKSLNKIKLIANNEKLQKFLDIDFIGLDKGLGRILNELER